MSTQSLGCKNGAMRNEPLTCLLSHKCNELVCGKGVTSLGTRLATALSQDNITLLIDPFRYGEDFTIRMQSVDFDALLFLITPESWKSEPCRIELETAQHRGVPIFTALLEGDIPAELSHRLSWKLQGLDDEAFAGQAHALAYAIRTRVLIRREIQLLTEENPPDVTQAAAENVAEADDRTVLAEFAGELALRYRKITDPTTRFWIALALGKACTPEAKELLRALPSKDHPLPLEGIRQALEILAQGC